MNFSFRTNKEEIGRLRGEIQKLNEENKKLLQPEIVKNEISKKYHNVLASVFTLCQQKNY